MIEESFSQALPQGAWKCVEKQEKSWSGPAHPASMYYLAEDSSEATDLIQLHPERAEAMTEKLRTMKEAKGILDLNL